MRLLAGFEKGESARYLSHLDFQRALQRLLRRSGLPVLYSAGFNPHPLLSYASALPVGATGDCEVVELQTQDIAEADALALLQSVDAPLKCTRVRIVPAEFPSLTPLTQAARWDIALLPDEACKGMAQTVEAMLTRPLIVQKKGKAGVKPLDVTPLIFERVVSESEGCVRLSLIGAHTQAGSLPVGLLAEALRKAHGPGCFRLHRRALLTRKGDEWINIMDC